jgi:hypothetical protein
MSFQSSNYLDGIMLAWYFKLFRSINFFFRDEQFTAMRNSIFLLLCLLTLSACVEHIAPISAGKIVDSNFFTQQSEVDQNAHPQISWDLSTVQIHELTLWLGSHRSNWFPVFTTLPPPYFSLFLRHEDGTRSQLEIMLLKGNLQAVSLIRLDKKGKVVSRKARRLSREDIDTMHHFFPRGQRSQT